MKTAKKAMLMTLCAIILVVATVFGPMAYLTSTDEVVKALLLALCAVSLVTASVLGTMAYLTSTDKVENTFTVGSVAITMDEKDVDDSTPNADRDTKNSYKLLPGQTYTKDPTIHVGANSEDCFLFVKVENEIKDIESTEEGKSVAAQMAAQGWVAVDEPHPDVYVKMKDGALQTVKGGEDVTVFKTLTIAGSVDGTKLQTYSGKNINVTAYAVQKDGFEQKSAAEIWAAAFPTV